MEKWDVLTKILNENDLKDLLEIIHNRTKWNKGMMETIVESIIKWKENKHDYNEIVEALLKYCRIAKLIEKN